MRTGLLLMLLVCACALSAADKYVEADKGLYVWNASSVKPTPRDSNHHAVADNLNGLADRLATFAKLHGFTRVYLFLGSVQWDWETQYRAHKLPNEDKLAETVAMLNKQGLDVLFMWYLNDDANDLSNHERAADLVDTLAEFNKRHPKARVAGLHCDQEPDSTDAYAGMVAMFKLMGARNDELKAKLSLGAAFKPLWLRQDWQGRKVFQHFLDELTTATLMAYSNKPATVKQLAGPLLQYAEKTGKQADVAIETGGYNAAPEETFAEQVKAEPRKFLDTVADLSRDLGKQKGFDRLVIHAYAQYFNDLYSLDPDVKDANPTELFGPIPSDAALPDAPLPENARGFIGKLTGKVTAVGRSGFAIIVSKQKSASDNAAKDADVLEDATVIVRADDETERKWISTLKPDDDVSIEVSYKDAELHIAALSSSQKKAARKAD